MCELLTVAWPRPEPFARILPWALALERYGIAGFGWGVAWQADGTVQRHRDSGRLVDDLTGQAHLAGVRSQHFLVHLRRPSQLSTTALADTQPFLADGGAFAFAHNGRLDGAEAWRERIAAQLHGRADSEVGFRLFEALLAEGMTAAAALPAVHQRLGGTANLAVLPAVGPPLVYAGAPGNAVRRFRLEGAVAASTSLHSADQALFTLCFPGATDHRQVAPGTVGVTEAGPGPAAPTASMGAPGGAAPGG